MTVLKNKYIAENVHSEHSKLCIKEKNDLIAQKVRANCKEREMNLNEIAYNTELSRLII